MRGAAPKSEKPSADIARVVAAVERVVGDAKRPVHLHEPSFGARERELLNATIDSGWVSAGGKYVDEFERRVAAIAGVKHAVAVVNGTAALHTAMLLAGVRPGDEVLMPAITFVATANAASHAGAVPHFVDSSWDALGLDPEALDRHLQEIADLSGGVLLNRRTRRPIRAVVPVHIFGHPLAFDALAKVAQKYRLAVVEDAAEAIGSIYRGKPCGSLGLCAAMSFNGNKIVTTGGGGAVLTDDRALAERARHITTTAKRPHRWEFFHDEVAYNYRLPNLNAALGCAQMERIDEFIAAKRRLAAKYASAFRELNGVRFLSEPAQTRSNSWLNTIVLDGSDANFRDALLVALHERQILARPVWTPMHLLPMYRECPRAPLSIAEDIYARTINLPSSPFLAPRC